MKELLQKLVRRIKPRNGMAVNARVWAEAHDYHRFHQQAHALFGHGPGIVVGLEVRAEGPGSRRVWIQPGLAVDPQGRLIILEEQRSKEVGADQAGLIYLFIEGAGEGDFYDEDGASERGPHHVRDGYVIENALTLPSSAVELARVRLSSGAAEIKDAAAAGQPAPDEIDMRFRPHVGAASAAVGGMAICYMGQPGAGSLPLYGRQAGYLARALSHAASHRWWIDDAVPLTADLLPYTLVYLVEQGPYTLSWAEIDALKAYLHKGRGTLLVESYQAAGHDDALLNLLASLGAAPGDLAPQHPLLAEPFLFSAPPAGTREGPVLAGEGVIFSARQYGRLWQRSSSEGRPATREDIRAAIEWGANIITYAAKRRHGG